MGFCEFSFLEHFDNKSITEEKDEIFFNVGLECTYNNCIDFKWTLDQYKKSIMIKIYNSNNVLINIYQILNQENEVILVFDNKNLKEVFFKKI